MQLNPTLPSPAGLRAPAPEMLQALLSEALTLVDSDLPGARACLGQALRLVSQPPAVRDVSGPRGRNPMLAAWQANRVAAFVTEHLENRIRVEELAALTRLTSGYFSKAFRGTFGLSPHAYLVERRIARACELMVGSDQPLAQIALACGHYDQAHFTRVFRKRHGEAPGSWRRNRREAPTSLAA
jgi:AraC-like DNA-binding protein